MKSVDYQRTVKVSEGGLSDHGRRIKRNYKEKRN